jgi:caa(3)-type oxidase subunit IV
MANHENQGSVQNSHGHHHITPLSVYRNVWLALIVLTVITVVTSYIDFGGHLNIIIAMMIACFKALLVTSYFMGLKYDDSENNFTFYGTFLFLVIFVVLTAFDLFWRDNPTRFAKVDSDSMNAVSAENINIKDYLNPSKDLLDKGAQIFAQQCASCHGAQGKGDGPAAAALNPKPRNFTANENWKNERTLSGIFKTITNGLPGSPMPGFASLSVQDRIALAHYVRSLNSSSPAISDSDEKTLSGLVGGPSKPKLPIDFVIDRMAEPEKN